jgi:hypothetical protein
MVEEEKYYFKPGYLKKNNITLNQDSKKYYLN